jgi:hypothetical protein
MIVTSSKIKQYLQSYDPRIGSSLFCKLGRIKLEEFKLSEVTKYDLFFT